MRETAALKARRLLCEGRVTVLRVDGDVVEATVRGDSAAVYRVGHDPARGWRCDCPAYRPACSHVRAVQLVVVLARPRAASARRTLSSRSTPACGPARPG
jgi:uncharacterized Zn finger protein